MAGGGECQAFAIQGDLRWGAKHEGPSVSPRGGPRVWGSCGVQRRQDAVTQQPWGKLPGSQKAAPRHLPWGLAFGMRDASAPTGPARCPPGTLALSGWGLPAVTLSLLSPQLLHRSPLPSGPFPTEFASCKGALFTRRCHDYARQEPPAGIPQRVAVLPAARPCQGRGRMVCCPPLRRGGCALPGPGTGLPGLPRFLLGRKEAAASPRRRVLPTDFPPPRQPFPRAHAEKKRSGAGGGGRGCPQYIRVGRELQPPPWPGHRGGWRWLGHAPSRGC